MLLPKHVKESIITMTELVLPNHTNTIGTLLGGQLMHWIDVCGGLSAGKHSQQVCVTASVDRIDFHHPIKLGQVVQLVSSVNRAFHTSMEVGVRVFAQSFKDGTTFHTNTAFLTFVAIEDGKPVNVPEIIPESDDEVRRYHEALSRREARLQNRG
ncbi:MAG: acyl-CoA thioesterase [Bacteroidota bacterium]|nr:acyl-CoA thioesterase [Bacteroidota bacterium]